jgi:hypothetical protein
MEQILSRKKQYERVVKEHDPMFQREVAAIDTVRDFIREHGLIIYGGTAIDFALRLRGDRLYDDSTLAVPDLDFYSPKHAQHAYELADRFYAMGYEGVRTIVGLYTRVMRVDIGDKHFVADISYVPQNVFDRLTYLEYDGMRIIHPDFQRIDTHSSLCFPYDDPPIEVIFARWAKDFERFNMLAGHYPIGAAAATSVSHAGTRGASARDVCIRSASAHGANTQDFRIVRIPLESRHYVFAGVAACSIIVSDYHRRMRELNAEPSSDIPDLTFRVASNGSIEMSILDAVEFVCIDTEKTMAEFGIADYDNYEPYVNMLPAMSVGRIGRGADAHAGADVGASVGAIANAHAGADVGKSADTGVTGGAGDTCLLRALSIHGKLVSVNSVRIPGAGDAVFRVVNVQHALKYLLAQYFRDRDSALAPSYLQLYCGMLAAIDSYEHALVVASRQADAAGCPLFPSVSTYGGENRSLSYEVAIARIANALDGIPIPPIPRNYRPASGGAHPVFDPSRSEIFRESGEKIARNMPSQPAETQTPPAD